MIKAALLGATFLAAASVGANAADVYEPAEGGYKDDAVYYPSITWTGFYFGGHAGVAFDDADDSDEVFAGGIQIGYNWQKHGPWVFGVEADYSFIDAELVDYMASIRGRVGYAFDNLLVYGTGGIAFTEQDFLGDLVGWTAGLGMDYKLTQNISVGAETLYYNFEEDSGFDDAEVWQVRARLNYHFNRGYQEALK
ncbi:MAG: outer membrane protein [Rhodomicrobiaceae bacterium]